MVDEYLANEDLTGSPDTSRDELDEGVVVLFGGGLGKGSEGGRVGHDGSEEGAGAVAAEIAAAQR